MLSQDAYWGRLSIEARELQKEQPTFKPVSSSVSHWRGFILGTGVYKNGVFVFEVRIDREFPFKPPKVHSLTRIWHPNIHGKEVCVGILGRDWTPSNNIVTIIQTLRFLLDNPNPDDPLNTECAKQMKESFEDFKEKAKDFTKEYAGWEQIAEFDL